MLAALSRVMDDPIWSFLYGIELSLGGVSSCWGDIAQDEVFYVKLSELHSLVVVFGHLLLVLRHLFEGFLFYFI